MTDSGMENARHEPGRAGAVPRLHSQAAEILARRIRAGALPPGTRLLESRVAADFGISRAPARHALAALADEGLLSRAERRGYVVTSLAGSGDGSAEAPGPIHLSPAASWERIYAEVETNIVSRTAFASWRVVESEIAKHHGVSRTVAREVVARLNQRGIIRKDDSRWFAPALTPLHVTELYEMRWTLEPIALAKAADSVPKDLLRRALRSTQTAIARADTLTGADLDALEAELHGEILGFCGQRTLMEALRSYQSLLVAHSFLYRWTPALFSSEPFLPEHLKVLEALNQGRTDHAVEALREHLRASLGRALMRIEAVAAEFRPEPLPYLQNAPQASTSDAASLEGKLPALGGR